MANQREYEVTEEDIWAALNYANELIETEEFHPLPRLSEVGNALLDWWGDDYKNTLRTEDGQNNDD